MPYRAFYARLIKRAQNTLKGHFALAVSKCDLERAGIKCPLRVFCALGEAGIKYPIGQKMPGRAENAIHPANGEGGD